MTIRLPWAAVAALGLAAAAIAAADLLNPQYSPVSEVVSRYVNGTAGWLVTVAVLSIAGGSAVLVALLGRVGAGRWVLGLWAAGVLVAGVFPADPPGRWSRPSTAEMVHGTAAWLAFAVFPVAAVLLTGRLSALWRAGRTGLAWSAAASVLSTVVMAVFMVDVMDGPSLGAGGAPTLADVCVTSQVFGARFFNCDTSGIPTVMRVFDECMKLPAFGNSHPMKQPGAPKELKH